MRKGEVGLGINEGLVELVKGWEERGTQKHVLGVVGKRMNSGRF